MNKDEQNYLEKNRYPLKTQRVSLITMGKAADTPKPQVTASRGRCLLSQILRDVKEFQQITFEVILNALLFVK